MDGEQYKKLDELFDAVLELEPQKRQEFLDQACGNNLPLRREIESLLETYHKLGNFIETPALEVAAQSLAQDSNLSFTGKQIAHYKILSLLGSGGMGEVYLAEDLRLRRKLALKLLPAHFTRDADRIVRFQRESRAASALNHPNIITIYEIGQDQGIHFIASELIEGDTLRKKINRGKLSVKEAIDITVQTANALSAAHAAGIIHRDIKPENIMVRRDGYLKVLDFGLVKLTESGDSDAHNPSPLSLQTQSGAVLGTVNYMSPEQALGQEVDQRTDIFSLGVVLYEMVTGQSPFKGATVASTFDAILNKEPPSLTSSNPQVSPELERIVNRALEKDREMRYQTAADLRAVLRRLQKSLDSGITASANTVATGSAQATTRSVAHLWKRLALGLLAVTFVLALVSVLLYLRQAKPDGTIWQNALASKITDQQGREVFPSLSPDGQSLIYASRLSGNSDIYFKRVGSRKTINLTEGSEAQETQPALSPDGKRIAFWRTNPDGSGGIYVMSETGESPRPLLPFGCNPAWSPDGKEIVCAESPVESSSRGQTRSRMWIVNASTGEYRLLFEGDAVQPNWSPKGKRIAYWSFNEDTSQRDIWTIPAEGGEPVAVTNDDVIDFNPVWSADGKHIYFISSRSGTMALWRLAIDEGSGKVEGEAEMVPIPASRIQHIAFSSDGRHLAFVQVSSSQNIEKIAFAALQGKVVGEPVAVTQYSGEVTAPAISPDGEALTFQSLSGNPDILTLKLNSAIPNSVTEDRANDANPVWAPDSKRLAYHSNKTGVYQIWTANPDGSGAQQLTQVAAPGAVLPVWSPDASQLAYSLFGGKTFLMDLRKSWSEQTPVGTPSDLDDLSHFVARSWSPDGKYLAGSGYKMNSVGVVALFTYEIATRPYEKISEFGNSPKWLNDNRRLIFMYEDKLYLVDTASKKPQEIYAFAPKSLSGIDISKDNRSIFVSTTEAEADIWLLSLP
jgi:eukaryotic-like serine/threonine-protein kinase